MKIHGRLGPAAPEAGWVPAPRYLLRRARILRQLEGMTPCETLEIGCGAGVLLHELTTRGFRCHALESSPEARELAGQLAREAEIDIPLFERPGADWEGRFPLLMAFEVLEHIENDREALQAWRSWMPSGATLLLSVPAHMSKWNPSDVWAGHFRRYERRGLEALLRTAGFEPEAVECYGFPLATVSEKLTAGRYARANKPGDDRTAEGKQANSHRSGIDRSHVMKWFPLMDNPLGRAAVTLAVLAQRPFLGTELGNGYLVRATAR